MASVLESHPRELAAPQVQDVSRPLAGHYYYDPAVFEAEKTGVFYRNWLFAAHRAQFEHPGDYVTVDIHDQSVFLILGDDDEVRAFYNACAHRAHPLVEGCGHAEKLVCPYHAWRYKLDGQLQYARRGSDPALASVESIGLTPVRMESLLGLLFINLDPDADSLLSLVPNLEADILRYAPFIDELKPWKQTDLMLPEVAANWKVVIDNYLECYHCGPAHPGFSEVFDVPKTAIEVDGLVSRQFVPARASSPIEQYPLHHDDASKVGVFWFLWPNTGLMVIPGAANFYVSAFDPVAPGRCRRRFMGFGLDDHPSPQEATRDAWLSATVAKEDISLCENVQRGLRQRGYQQGFYADGGADIDETALRAFHARYLSAMNR